MFVCCCVLLFSICVFDVFICYIVLVLCSSLVCLFVATCTSSFCCIVCV